LAPGAPDNIATEDLVLMAEQSGFSARISLDGLLQAVAFAEAHLDVLSDARLLCGFG
jgi:hydroxymethylglutaryl-CoA lyase